MCNVIVIIFNSDNPTTTRKQNSDRRIELSAGSCDIPPTRDETKLTYYYLLSLLKLLVNIWRRWGGRRR